MHRFPAKKACQLHSWSVTAWRCRPTPDSTLSREPHCYCLVSVEWQVWVPCPSSAGRFDTEHRSRDISAERRMTVQAWRCPFCSVRLFSWHILGLCSGDAGLEISLSEGPEREATWSIWAQLRLLLCDLLLQQNLNWRSLRYFKYDIVHHISDTVGQGDVWQ